MDYRKIESFQPSESYIRNEEKVYYGTSQPSEDCTKIQMLNSKCGNSPIEMDSDKGTCREIDQPSGSSTERQMPDGSKLPIEADKNLEKNREMREETDKAEVVLNICPGRSDFSIKVNGTSLTTSSTSLNATIGNFSLSVNFLDYPCNRPLPFTVAVASVSLGKPLFVVLGSYPYVTAAVSLTKGISNPNSYELVSIQSNGQGMYYMSANKNAYYVAIISGNKVRVLSESEIANINMYTFRQERVTSSVVRFYIETTTAGENRRYLMVKSNGDLTALDANDLVLDSQNDTQSRFRFVYE